MYTNVIVTQDPLALSTLTFVGLYLVHRDRQLTYQKLVCIKFLKFCIIWGKNLLFIGRLPKLPNLETRSPLIVRLVINMGGAHS